MESLATIGVMDYGYKQYKTLAELAVFAGLREISAGFIPS